MLVLITVSMVTDVARAKLINTRDPLLTVFLLRLIRSLNFLQTVQFKRLTHRFTPAVSVSQPSHVIVMYLQSKSHHHFLYVEYITVRFLDCAASSAVLLVVTLFILPVPQQLATDAAKKKTPGQIADHVEYCMVILI